MKGLKEIKKSSLFFGGLCLGVILFNIEFYPFSNYQMYSKAFLPESHYRHLEITQLHRDGKERPFKNRRYGIFHAPTPLAEAIQKNRSRGKDLKVLGKSLLEYVNKRDPSIVGLNFYQVSYEWSQYKRSVLNEDGMESAAVRRELLEGVEL